MQYMHVLVICCVFVVCCLSGWMSRPQFGSVFDLMTSEFVDCIDKEPPTVFVIVHIYEKVSSLHAYVYS